ncbi:MAG: hypothetical protein IPI61_06170 [Syntrophaceae bacterium]|jgi:hypothetical protein|nr:hypothetical protein [Syntrophaceae bacterium]HOF73355.1 hypothetical protein [Syntrophales bacterium]HQM90397.1 hypothetical protein [Syntrophales bacterium]
MKKGRVDHGPVQKKAVGSFGLPTARLFICSQALWADLPKEAEKAKKSEKAARVDVPVHHKPLVQAFYPMAAGPVNTFFPLTAPRSCREVFRRRIPPQ